MINFLSNNLYSKKYNNRREAITALMFLIIPSFLISNFGDSILVFLACASLFIIIMILSKFVTFLLFKHNNTNEITLKKGYTKIEIKYGDIFSNINSNAITVIPIDDEYTNYVDEIKITKNTLHGKLINDYAKKEMKIVDKPPIAGFKGSFFDNNKYYLFPIAKLDENYQIKLSRYDYISRLLTLMYELDSISNLNTIRLPLIGDGASRIEGINEEEASQEKLKLLINIIKMYNFKKRIHFEIILFDKNKKNNEIKLYEIVE